MIIGIDFDNTIACHDESFRKVALNEGLSIDKGKKPKQVVKDFFLGKENGNLEWTRIQGKIYGSDISSAELFDGFLPFLKEANSLGHKLFVISHRTRFPAWGEEIDLHKAALQWLSEKGVLAPDSLSLENCFFEISLEKKIERIERENCSIFIDDLEQILEHSGFPDRTKQVLFGKKHSTLPTVMNWDEARKLLNNEQAALPPDPVKKNWVTLPYDQHLNCFRKLLQKKGKGELTAMKQVKRGGNNCVYKIEIGEDAILGKIYHRDTHDSRDRFGQEMAFVKYLASIRVKESPPLIAQDQSAGAACFDWIDGTNFDSGLPLCDDYWKQCFSFLKKIQAGKKTIEAQNLPSGSEAAFSFRAHFAFLQNRRDYWLSHSDNQTIPAEIRSFLSNDLDEQYKSLARELISHPDFNKELEQDEKIISPSDFGLHNAKLKEDGKLAFFDFEYGGWDDPAKTVADFFAQPRLPAPPEEFSTLLSTFSEILTSQVMKRLLKRLPLVERIIRLKWCYILLNDFHPVSSKRRILSGMRPNSKEQILSLMNGFVNTNPLLTNSL
ncbi:MAG: phosphotransferase [Opitutae bacterium]|nr:phosphotransferase [Opitutae bacterium]